MNDIKQNTLVLGRGFLGRCFERNDFNVKTRSFFEVFKFVDDYDLLINTKEFQNADVIINCIGNSDTRYCESHENWPEIQIINGLFPGLLSMICEWYNKKLVHISTGCVYSGTEGVKTEESPIESHCRYVTSKLIAEFNCNPERDLIIRPRLLFDIVDDPKNLITKFKSFNKFLNEFNTVTSNQTIVESITALLENDCSGIFNVGNRGTYTIAKLASAAGMKVDQIIHQGDLIRDQGLFLVNNVMSLDKLQEFYQPRDAIDEVKYYSTKNWDIV